MPVLVVIGGPNGSGKTTLTGHLIKQGRIRTDVINPDEIAIKKFGSYTFKVKAAKAALELRKNTIAINNDLAFETTFSGNSEITDIISAKASGYKIILYYITLESIIDSIIRVEEREHNLGHAVELADQIRRYDKSYDNLIKNISLFDIVYLFDNSGIKRSRVAIFQKGVLMWLNAKHKNHAFYKELF